MSDRKEVRRLLGPAGMVVTLLVAAALPGMADARSGGWRNSVFFENDTHYRGEDSQNNTIGLSKLRNTLQAEFRNEDLGGWDFKILLRGSYDGVYKLNQGEYGDQQGRAIELQSKPIADVDLVSAILTGLNSDLPGIDVGLPSGTAALTSTSVPHGGGLSVGFLDFNSDNPNAPRYNPNQGLNVLGEHWHNSRDGGVRFGTPVRPCNVDKRGCKDFGDYGNADEDELISQEFNDRQDWLRELNISQAFPINDGEQEIFIKLGRQQIVWGRTDLFRVLDVINPVDFSRNNIYDELQDIRYPMWIAQAEYRMGAMGPLSDANVQLVWNFDKFRPANLGQCGQPNVILNAGCLFRGLVNIWENGGTVSNFARITPDSAIAVDFGPHQLGIRSVEKYPWELKNTQIGVKFEGVTENAIGFSINALDYRSQLPALKGGTNGESVNGFTGETGRFPYIIAFDLVYPRVQLIGGSLDINADSLKTVFRVEAALTRGELFPDTTKEKLFSEHKVFRAVLGADRLDFIPFISKSRTTLLSFQTFYQYILNHNQERGPQSQIGMPDWEHNFITTFVVKAFLARDRVSPQLIQAYGWRDQTYVVSPQVDWLITDKLRVTLGANIKTLVGDARDNWEFDDARGTNPWPPFTAVNIPGNDPAPLEPGSRGFQGLEPLGVFRAGPLGTAVSEDEIYLGFRYSLY